MDYSVPRLKFSLPPNRAAEEMKAKKTSAIIARALEVTRRGAQIQATKIDYRENFVAVRKKPYWTKLLRALA